MSEKAQNMTDQKTGWEALGYVMLATVMRREFSTLLVLLVGGACALYGEPKAKELVGVYTPADTVCPTPEEAQKQMAVPEGYDVRCFAHEPMVQNPVAMTWDHRGRLWVVEAYEYPNGSDHPAPFGGEAKDDQYHPMPTLAEQRPRDKVLILEDTDNDGVADKRTVFVEGLNLASAILCGDDGIYVGQQPHLLHFRDKDGDDKPDQWRVCLTGFGREDTHELMNSFSWGPDGWLYMTHGVFTNSKVRRPGQPEAQGFKFDAGIGRARVIPRELAGKATGAAPWEFEVFTDGTSNPWGCDFDAAGNYFVSACVIDHLFHMAAGGLYVRQGGAPENSYGYELLPSIVKHKHFRAAYAGIQIYQGGRYPKDVWGHCFIGNIHDNAIHEEVLTPVGANFKAEPRRDFLRANNGWFRPVSTQTGPDGFLWVMDWCDKYPCYQNAKANPEGVDRERGRIWRVVHLGEKEKATASREAADLNLKKRSTKELIETLEHSNNWMARMARRLLGERGELSAEEIAAVKAIAFDKGKIEALWTLENLRQAEALTAAATSGEASYRKWFARAAGAGVADASVLSKLAEDEAVEVRAATAVALRQTSARYLTVDREPAKVTDEGLKTLEALIRANAKPQDELMPFQIWMAMEPMVAAAPEKVLALLGHVAADAQPLSQALTFKTLRRLCDTKDGKNVDLAMVYCEKIGDQASLLAHALDGLVRGQEGGLTQPTQDVAARLAVWRKHANADVRKQAQTLAVLWGDEAAVKEVIATAQDGKKPEKERLTAIQSLRKVRTETVKQGLLPLLTGEISANLGVAAIRAAADLGGDLFVAPLVGRAASKDFNLRNAALEALASRENWATAMLTAIEEGKVPAAGFPAPVRRQLATSQNKALRDQAFRALGAWKDTSDDVKALIAAKKQAALTGEPDLANGKMLFTATCMVCHEFHGGGMKVGPDLIGSGRSNLDALLANVIDPNQIIGNGYENIIVATKDGRTVAGRIVEDTPGHVKLVGAGGATQVVARDQIAQLTNTKQSLMPMGFGGLPDAAFRDLMWYILAPPEEGPLTKEKKEMLIRGVDGGEAALKPKGNNWRAIDWESVRLWSPAWHLNAPDFERTPVKLADYYGKSNVLMMHPFPDKKTPASFERKLKVEAAKTKLRFEVASDDRGDWDLFALVNGKEVKKLTVNAQKPRWKEVEIDLSPWAGKEIDVRLEVRASGWAWEFAYWHGLRLE